MRLPLRHEPRILELVFLNVRPAPRMKSRNGSFDPTNLLNNMEYHYLPARIDSAETPEPGAKFRNEGTFALSKQAAR